VVCSKTKELLVKRGLRHSKTFRPSSARSPPSAYLVWSSVRNSDMTKIRNLQPPRRHCHHCTDPDPSQTTSIMSQNKRAPPKKESILELQKLMDTTVRIKCVGGRELKGILRGYDELVNLVLDDCDEYLRGMLLSRLILICETTQLN
jgi:small nuclear ribonucleoprotein (snRNP)-like protein